jgi:hypothetical protein
MISSTAANQQSPATSTAWQSDQKGRVGSQNCSNNKNGEWKSNPSWKWPHRLVFEYDTDASRSSQRIQINENIHEWIRIKIYLSAMTLLLSSWFFTPFDVSEDSDWRKCFIAWRQGVTQFLCRRLRSIYCTLSIPCVLAFFVCYYKYKYPNTGEYTTTNTVDVTTNTTVMLSFFHSIHTFILIFIIPVHRTGTR